MTNIFKCLNPCCGAIQHYRELVAEEADDCYEYHCPRCNGHTHEMTEMEVGREECRTRFLMPMVVAALCQRRYKEAFTCDRLLKGEYQNTNIFSNPSKN